MAFHSLGLTPGLLFECPRCSACRAEVLHLPSAAGEIWISTLWLSCIPVFVMLPAVVGMAMTNDCELVNSVHVVYVVYVFHCRTQAARLRPQVKPQQ